MGKAFVTYSPYKSQVLLGAERKDGAIIFQPALRFDALWLLISLISRFRSYRDQARFGHISMRLAYATVHFHRAMTVCGRSWLWLKRKTRLGRKAKHAPSRVALLRRLIVSLQRDIKNRRISSAGQLPGFPFSEAAFTKLPSSCA
jgi:hypothetical protein